MTEHEYKSIASISQLTLGTALAVTLGGGKPRLCAVSISCWIGLQKWGGGGGEGFQYMHSLAHCFLRFSLHSALLYAHEVLPRQ